MEHTPVDIKRETFIDVISEMMERLNMRGLLVFDYRRQQPHDYPIRDSSGYLEVIYSPSNLEADAYILEYISTSDHIHSTTLVTSDRDLGFQAKDLGVRVMTVPSFIEKIRKKCSKEETKIDESKPIVDTSYEFQRLLDIFENRSDNTNTPD